jgi:hypothetical protein
MSLSEWVTYHNENDTDWLGHWCWLRSKCSVAGGTMYIQGYAGRFRVLRAVDTRDGYEPYGFTLEPVAGPFSDLDAAKATYRLIMGANNG